MTWRFHIDAIAQRRVFSRILQVLENQSVSIHYFKGDVAEGMAHVAVVCSSEQDKAIRIQALLYHLQGVRGVLIEEE
ncbi:MAG: hypothetical protein WDN23_04395 [Edaphobacter sp.]